jgi:hypothetical protein
MRGPVVVSIVIVGAVLAAAAPAAAQSPNFGGGLLPGASGKPGAYTPTIGIHLQPRGSEIAIRFDTTMGCGRYVEELTGRATVPFDGHSFRAKKLRWQFGLAGPARNRVTFSWRLSGTVDGAFARGRLRVTGARHFNGRTWRCNRKTKRRWAARVEGPAPTGAPMPPARAGFGGLDDIQLGDGLRGAVMLRVGGNAKKVGSRWTALAACGKGGPVTFVNYTPPMRIRADGSFSRAERFAVRFHDALLRYRVRFAGRISGEAANGTLRLRVGIFSRDGKRLKTRCDSGLRNWSAGRLP